jgi:L-threonylcarbamoyladenylate synthase
LSDIAAAAKALLEGRLVAFPTETVYGLGADAESEQAVSRIYSAKGRPSDHPLIVHIGSAKLLDHWSSSVPAYAHVLAEKFWPGPMTLILPRSESAGDFITGGQETVGLRIPNHPVALSLLSSFHELGGMGVAAPSANRFGKVSPTDASAVRDELHEYLEPGDMILEGGISKVGIESTIIACTGELPKILRPGAITEEMITNVTGLQVDHSDSKIRASGLLDSHYAPSAVVVLDEQPKSGDGFIAMSNVETPEGVVRLAAPDSIEQFAQLLYAALRNADELGLARVVAWQPTGSGLAIAVRDRLQRASHKA